MFRCFLVIHQGYHVLSVFNCPINIAKVSKLPNIATCACNFISKLLKGGTNMVAVFSNARQRYFVGCFDC